MGRIALRRTVRLVRTRRRSHSRPDRPGRGPREKIRTLIGCADPELAGRLVGALSGSPRVEAVGVAATPAEAAAKVAALRPDVVVFDIDLGGEMRGLEAGLALRRSAASPGLVMIAPDDDPGYLKGNSAGMGSEWSCLFTETAMQPGGLAYAAQCAAAAIPVVDPKLDWTRRDARRAERATSRAGPRAGAAADSYQNEWRGTIKTVSLPGSDGPPALL